MRRQCVTDGCDRAAFGRGLCSAHYQRARYHGELPADPGPRTCAQCGNLFTSRKWNAMYCSKQCNYRAHDDRRLAEIPRRTTACEFCGGDMEHKQRDSRFCSTECGQNWRNAERSAELLASKQGRPCRGCGEAIPAKRPANAEFCSPPCKIRSRRHESYGLTLPELTKLLEQHDVCAICKTNKWGKKGPQVDHCHKTGRIRGVLCINCNNGLGRFNDDPERLRAAAAYLGG